MEDFDSNAAKKVLTAEQKSARAIISEVEDKYAEKKRILLMGFEIAKSEENAHMK